LWVSPSVELQLSVQTRNDDRAIDPIAERDDHAENEMTM